MLHIKRHSEGTLDLEHLVTDMLEEHPSIVQDNINIFVPPSKVIHNPHTWGAMGAPPTPKIQSPKKDIREYHFVQKDSSFENHVEDTFLRVMQKGGQKR